MAEFKIIQGGMGAAVSSWRLARTVSKLGQLGVVSGTALSAVMARRLQSGDAGGHVRRALRQFPLPCVGERIIQRYFIDGGKADTAPFKLTPMPRVKDSQAAIALTVAANFVEVFLARENHSNPVGINYLEKIQLHHLPAIFGAMLAGVDYVLMGAGIPRFIPGAIDALAAGQAATYPIDIEGAIEAGREFTTSFDPAEFFDGVAPSLKRPKFFPIISSATLAITLARKSNGRVDGFIVEEKTAGGHNAPPRGTQQLNERGEPIYGPRDVVDLEKIRSLDLPFYLAGGYGHPGKLEEALAHGAAGIQVGTAFAFCEESGINPEIKLRALARARESSADIFTDPIASPTGFPLKVMRLEQTLSEPEIYEQRKRICDLGFLRRPFLNKDGTIGYRCPSEPVEQYVRKGGDASVTVGRKCLCNGLLANVSLGQMRSDGAELPLVTAGDASIGLHHFLRGDRSTYTAADVIEVLLLTQSPHPALSH